MGTWGQQPWENDSAADWFADLWNGVPLADRVGAALRSEDSHERVAALWVCVSLCWPYIWPPESLGDTLTGAVASVTEILEERDPEGYLALWGDDPDVRRRLETMLKHLSRSDRRPSGA